MSRGVLAIFGSFSSSSSINIIRSITNHYDLPFISITNVPRRGYYEQLQSDYEIRNKLLNNSTSNNYKDIIMHVVNKQSEVIKDNNRTNELNVTSNFTHSQLFMRPNIIPVLIELIKHYKFSTIYYIYNYESGMQFISFVYEN
jgi:hypothetical protein